MMPHPRNTFATIGEVARGVVPGARVLRFGSHARREARPESDYDILLITQQPLEAKSKLALRTQIRKQLLERDIRCDVLLQSEHETQVKKDLPGHIVRAGLREGVPL